MSKKDGQVNPPVEREPECVKAMSIVLLDDEEDATGIEGIRYIVTPASANANANANAIYDLSGRQQQSLKRGINILRGTDGVRKVLVK